MDSEPSKDPAAPWKEVVTLAGTSAVFRAARTWLTAAPSDTPGAASKPMVAAGNWATRVTWVGASFSVIEAKALSGVAPPEAWRFSCPRDWGVVSMPGAASRMTRYWLVSVKMVETIRWPKAL